MARDPAGENGREPSIIRRPRASPLKSISVGEGLKTCREPKTARLIGDRRSFFCPHVQAVRGRAARRRPAAERTYAKAPGALSGLMQELSGRL